MFNEDGSIEYINETSTGLSGTASQILDENETPVAHEAFLNGVNDTYSNGSVDETLYPRVNVSVGADSTAKKVNAMWEIEPGKADKTNEAYVSIEAYNKPGMYLKANYVSDTDSYEVVLARDHNNNSACEADGTTVDSEAMTFRTLEGFDGTGGVTFESVAYPGYYITSEDGKLLLSKKSEEEACTFDITTVTPVKAVTALKAKRTYEVGEKLNVNDLRIRVAYGDDSSKILNSGFTTNAATINMSTPGTKVLTVTYEHKGTVNTCNININVLAKETIATGDIDAAEELPQTGAVYTVGNLKYKITKTDEYNTDGSNGTVSVTGIKSRKLKKIAIPTEVEIEGYNFKVTAIASKAFYKCSKLKTITIGDNVKSIGKNAIKGIHKKATIKVSKERYKAVKKLLKSKTGYNKKTMKIQKMK